MQMVTYKSPAKIKTLVDLLRERTQQKPDSRAYTFLVDGEKEGTVLTYQELEKQVKAIATYLQDAEVAGERALLFYQSGIEFVVAFWACLYAGVIAIPCYPPRRNRSVERVQSILRDSGATLVMTTSQISEALEQRAINHPELQEMQYFTTDILAKKEIGDYWEAPEIDGESLAFLQYTSGSTSDPKGVMVSHANLLHNLAFINKGFELSEETISVTWLPNIHDMGLIDGILGPIFNGGSVYIMSPLSFLQQPLRWLKAIDRYRGTHSGGPNFGYELCVRRVSQEQMADLDLSCWESAYNGAEPVRRYTLEKFSEHFKPAKFQPKFFYPCYGLAEGTLMVSGGSIHKPPYFANFDAKALGNGIAQPVDEGQADVYSMVSCGWSQFNDTRIAIVDPETQEELDENVVGEIWVSGPSIAQGYWNRPEQTKEVFQAHIANSGDGPFLRTGDLGFLHKGELFVTGRIKDLIIIDGRNHYPQDIELTVEESHEAVHNGCVAAFSVDIDNKERLVIVAELQRSYRPQKDDPEEKLDEVMQAIRRQVSEEHELHVHAIRLIKTGTIPKTTSGKIQRYASRLGYMDDTLQLWASS